MRKLAELEKYIMLTILNLGSKKAYGIQIREELSIKTEKHVSVGAVYTTLSRLKNKGYAEAAKAAPTPERGGKSKEYYKLTSTGKEALKNSLDTHNRFLTPMVECKLALAGE